MKLYGDGIHDDTQAIQALLDEKTILVELPAPAVCYLISAPLRIHSHQELRLPRYCHVKLAPMSDCRMITNAGMEAGDEYITVSGGIWDYNNMEQSKNPILFGDYFTSTTDIKADFDHLDNPHYDGFCMYFCNVKHLTLRDFTLKDVITFACTLDIVSWFTVENIVFDFNLGNPYPVNMDGIHLNGNCHYGTIRNIKGATYDDLVALNADEGSSGPITHIDIDGLYAESCQSFVRLLTVRNRVENIHIRNVHGTSFLYAIGITKFYNPPTTGWYDNIDIANIYVNRGTPIIHPDYDRGTSVQDFAMITVEDEVKVKSLTIRDYHRNEPLYPVPSLHIFKTAEIDHLTLEHCECEDNTGLGYPLVKNEGTVHALWARDLRHRNGEVWEGNAPEVSE